MPEPSAPNKQPERRKPLSATLVAAIAAALVALSLVGTSQPVVCGACHEPQSHLSRGAHASTSCYRCHVKDGAWGMPAQKLSELFGMYPSALLGKKPSGPVTETTARACLDCHRSVLDGVIQAKGRRIVHSACAKGASCDPCHSETPHGAAVREPRRPAMEDCIACHRTEKITVECDACHTGKGERDRLATGPWQVTHGPNWEKTHGMGRMDSCAVCHPSAEAFDETGKPSKGYCARCHGAGVPHDQSFGAQHGRLAKNSRSDCMSCHKQSSFCDSCHGMHMPHPQGFLQRHSKEATLGAEPLCTRCHADDDCDKCHSYHIHPGGAKAPPVPPGGAQ